ncbi:MAG TPA: hypothetical protein HPQ04_13025 [Rhodospirillaceae bacterium]|nr:hypothetical protein [Rhodospirillaceae bacterium]
MSATLRYVLITAIRDRFVAAIAVALAAAVGAAALLGASAVAEGQALALAYAGEMIRLVLVLGLITFISFHVRRMHETREIEAILARPISRATFVLAYYTAYSTIALGLSLLASPLLMLVLGAGGAGLAEWQASLMLECLVVVGLALFAAMSLESATAAVLAALGFYVLGRSAAVLRAIAEAGTAIFGQDALNLAARWVSDVIALLMPRLDLFGQSRWLVYGPGGGWGLSELLLQTLIYAPLLLAATIRDLDARRF